MKIVYRSLVIVGLGLVTCLYGPTNAQAIPVISAFEQIRDGCPYDLFSRNLTRFRSSTAGVFELETDESLIVAENQINDNFGIFNPHDVSYAHVLDWLVPPPDTYVFAKLEITAFGAQEGNDLIYIEDFEYELGSLVGGHPLGFSTTVWSSDNETYLDLILGDGVLDVAVDKEGFAMRFFKKHFYMPDYISVFSSKLIVEYLPSTGGGSSGAGGDDTPVPATANTLILLGIGLIFLESYKRILH